jgi:small subunit ribosomal protein S3e
MESGANGCEVVVSGKLRAARAKSMKFTEGFMIHSGQPARDYVDYAVRHVLLRQGVLGIKVKIMKPHDPEGKKGPMVNLPDKVLLVEPKAEAPIEIRSDHKDPPVVAVQQTAPQPEDVAAPVAEQPSWE